MDGVTKKDLGGVMAGSMIAAALLDTLKAKGVLSLAEVRGTIQAARGALGEYPSGPLDTECVSVLDWMLTVRFPDNGGE